jgi:hypothetical protein
VTRIHEAGEDLPPGELTVEPTGDVLVARRKGLAEVLIQSDVSCRDLVESAQ